MNTCNMRCLNDQCCDIPEDQAPCATHECPTCGGQYVLINLECQHCYGDFDGRDCDTDSCPAFGITTEERCRCENPPANLPVYKFNEFFSV